jgi:hypothetical protein
MNHFIANLRSAHTMVIVLSFAVLGLANAPRRDAHFDSALDELGDVRVLAESRDTFHRALSFRFRSLWRDSVTGADLWGPMVDDRTLTLLLSGLEAGLNRNCTDCSMVLDAPLILQPSWPDQLAERSLGELRSYFDSVHRTSRWLDCPYWPHVGCTCAYGTTYLERTRSRP